MTTLNITGNTLNRFIETSVLLFMLDPARGDPTVVYSLDQEDIQEPRERLLKRKFLDSIALICSTAKEKGCISAACLEEYPSEETILRISSNAGVSDNTVNSLREIIEMLSSFDSGSDPLVLRKEILREIIKLDMSKIQHYVKNIIRNASSGGLAEPVPVVESRVTQAISDGQIVREFCEWYRHIFSIPGWMADDLASDALFNIINWAEKGRRYYPELMGVAFPTPDASIPGWVEMTLASVLTRIADNRGEQLKPQLANLWAVEDIESVFRNKCNLDLVVHAEMQLVSFYDDNPDCKPIFRFIGFLSIEAKQHLLTRLGERRQVQADSTVGHSLGGLTGTRTVGSISTALPQRYSVLQNSSAENGNRNTSISVVREEESSDSQSSRMEATQSVNLGPQSTDNEASQEVAGRRPPTQLDASRMSVMVFHCVRENNPNKQDIVRISDILDHKTNSPSWTQLITLLGADEPLGISFKEGIDYLLINNTIHVTGERQLHACVQYLCNLEVLNAQVSVRSLSELSAATEMD
ncbi:hypothetical protein B7463_g11221, partial [Scytalidium lignicola]